MREVKIDDLILPDDLVWIDEFEYSDIAQSQKRTLNGALIINESAKVKGRSITIDSVGAVWVTRSKIQALKDMNDTLNGIFTLTFHERSYLVKFNKSSGSAITVKQVVECSDPNEDSPYTVTIRLIEVGTGSISTGSGGSGTPTSDNLIGIGSISDGELTIIPTGNGTVS